jgi:hypothetical protein
MPTIRSFADIIAGAGAPAPLICLDPAFAASYPGSGQTYADLSGHGNDFKLGTGSGGDGADPTFHGSGGGQSGSEYFSVDGGDTITVVGSNPCQSFHKNNAAFTILQWINLALDGVNQCGVCGDQVFTINNGFRFDVNSNGALNFRTGNGSVQNFITTGSPGAVPSGEWCLIGISIDEAAGASGGFFFGNDTFELFDATYPSPSGSNATGVLSFSGWEGTTSTGRMMNGSLLGPAAIFNAALTQAQVQAIWAESGIRYGVTVGLDATIAGAGTLSATLAAEARLAGTLDGGGTLSADLYVPGAEPAPANPLIGPVLLGGAPLGTLPLSAAKHTFEAESEPDAFEALGDKSAVDLIHLVRIDMVSPVGG